MAVLARYDRAGGFGLAQGGRRERDGQIVVVRGKQRDGARIAHLPQPLGDATEAGAERPRRQALDDHQKWKEV